MREDIPYYVTSSLIGWDLVGIVHIQWVQLRKIIADNVKLVNKAKASPLKLVSSGVEIVHNYHKSAANQD